MPKCDIYTLKSGKEICGFEASVWFGKVLTVDADLVHTKEQLKNEKARSVELALQVKILEGQIVTHRETRKFLEDREVELNHELLAVNKKYELERVKPRWGNPLAWTAAAVSTAVLAGFIIKDFAD